MAKSSTYKKVMKKKKKKKKKKYLNKFENFFI